MYEIFKEAKVACGLSHLAKVTHWRGVGAMYAESEYIYERALYAFLQSLFLMTMIV